MRQATIPTALVSTVRATLTSGFLFLAFLVALKTQLVSSASAEVTFLNTWGSEGSGDGEFDRPGGVAVSATGQVYVADHHNHRIQRFDAEGTFETKWSEVSSSFDIAVSGTGQVYVAYPHYHRIRRFDADGNYDMQWDSSSLGNGDVMSPHRIASSDTGQVYVADRSNHRIQRFDANGTYQLQWGSQGTGDIEFGDPADVAVSDTGKIYVVDRSNHRIQRFDADGKYEAEWGGFGNGNGQFTWPSGIAVSDTGKVYVADWSNYRIQRFDADGKYEAEWGGFGNGNGQFDSPSDIAVSTTGQVYVVDQNYLRNNNRIQRFFDSESWVSGTNTFVNPSVGPTSVEVGTSGHILGASLTLDAGKGLVVGDTTTVWGGGSLSVSGGTLSTSTLTTWPGSSLSLSGGTLSASVLNLDSFQFSGGTLNLTGPSGLTVGSAGLLGSLVTVGNSQTLNVTSATTIESGARITALGGFSSTLLKIESGGHFDAPSGYTNNDEIQLIGSEAWIMGSTLTNNGFISGQGRINASLTNNGQVNVSNGTLIIGSQVVNNGNIDVSDGTFRFDSQVTNNGQVNVSGGTLRFGSQVTNNASGFISGQGSSNFHFNGNLGNSGKVLLSFALSTVFGNITNNPGGMVSLAGNSTATFVGDMVNDGTIYVGSGSHAVFGGDTSGSGNFLGSGLVEFVDGFSPGSSPAEVGFGGDIILGTSSTTLIELGETSDQLLVDGNASIDGGLNVELLGDFTPTQGDQFPVITAGTRDGEFDTIDGIQVAADLTLAPIYDYAGHIGLMLIAAAPGDANFDGIVDVADLGILGANFNAADMQWNTGDFNLDSTTDVADLGILGANWSASQSTGNASALVPEPTTLSLLAMSVLMVGCRRR